MQFTDFWIGKIQADKLPEALDTAGLIKYLSVYTSDEQCFHIIFQWHETTLKRSSDWWFPKQELLNVIQAKISKKGVTDTLRHCLELLDTSEKKTLSVAADKVNIQIDILLHGGPELLISRRDSLGIIVIEFLSNIKSTRQREYWTAFVDHCLNVGEGSAPNRKWWKKAKELVGRINAEHFIAKLKDWISFSHGLLMRIHEGRDHSFVDYDIDFLSAINHNMLKAVIWCSAIPDNKALLDILEPYALWAYKKKEGIGPLSAKTGTACIYALTFLPFREALTRISRFRSLIRHAGILKSIDKILHELAEEHDIPLYELEEYIVPDYGLNKEGTVRVQIGTDLIGVYAIGNTGKSTVSWERDGKPAKGPHAWFAPGMEFKRLTREIDQALINNSARIERAFMRMTPWPYSHWKIYYLDHPLVRTLTTRLIWKFNTNGLLTTGYYLDGLFIDCTGKPLTVTEETAVSLWHPMNEPAKTVKAWRNFLDQRHIDQPFKQVDREIFTPNNVELADGFYSSRFASQVLNKQKFKNVITQRGWTLRQKAQHNWAYIPYIQLTDWDIRVNFFADRKEEETVLTDMINFYKEGEPLALRDVPAVIFSETIRDISYFVNTAGTTELHNRS
ncbi:DUF4132 domain-containing protein [Chitinophaga sp. S165]|uniref:DUF4132 domain-containing protein n=1 Tax=Chitinophaga sp. S165 TaxID=2135462 RepID=UPI000D715E63|nr:DUF4132 domain-containing protein [Chitinophaga sp. S165]PWV55952.1 uncharacterized protein DUF4132 [Chitinophaga sp. S165]